MLTPFTITELMRADLLRARSMACALARNLSQVLDNADRALPFALTRLDDLLADDIIRLWSCLQGAYELHHRLAERQIKEMALLCDPTTNRSKPATQAAP